tara:strand:- start:822 stop:1157 length:336 start_codon:yes stop_codon:yes gene_type:complete
MIKNNLIISAFFCLLIFLSACQSAKDGLTGKRKDNTDEFLVQKKNPLVLPPDYNDLPEPKRTKKDEDKISQENNEDIKKLIESGTKESSSNTNTSKDQSLENSILKTLNEN